jgi:hypothetical protein
MQTVVLLVASLLAVPLAFGLLVFLGATAISGPQGAVGRDSQRDPLLLACAAGSFVLANAIARHDDKAMTRSRVMRGAGLALAAVILPLAVFAAFSMGLRLEAVWTRAERLWGLVAPSSSPASAGLATGSRWRRGRNGAWPDPAQGTFPRRAVRVRARGAAGAADPRFRAILDDATSRRLKAARCTVTRSTSPRCAGTSASRPAGAAPGEEATADRRTRAIALAQNRAGDV